MINVHGTCVWNTVQIAIYVYFTDRSNCELIILAYFDLAFRSKNDSILNKVLAFANPSVRCSMEGLEGVGRIACVCPAFKNLNTMQFFHSFCVNKVNILYADTPIHSFVQSDPRNLNLYSAQPFWRIRRN